MAMKDKDRVRKKILALRDGLTAAQRAEYNASIAQIVLSMKAYREASAILAYASYRSEVDTHALIERALDDGKIVFAPKVSGQEMEFWQILSPDDLQKGYRGIPEPQEGISFTEWLGRDGQPEESGPPGGPASGGGAPAEARKVVMWMPGAAFDIDRHRIGYGGGYYDRYLQGLQAVSDTDGRHGRNIGQRCALQEWFGTMALAYSIQVLEAVPCEEHDITPDMIVTEKGVIGSGAYSLQAKQQKKEERNAR